MRFQIVPMYISVLFKQLNCFFQPGLYLLGFNLHFYFLKNNISFFFFIPSTSDNSFASIDAVWAVHSASSPISTDCQPTVFSNANNFTGTNINSAFSCSHYWTPANTHSTRFSPTYLSKATSCFATIIRFTKSCPTMRLLQSKHVTGRHEGKKYFLFTERE